MIYAALLWAIGCVLIATAIYGWQRTADATSVTFAPDFAAPLEVTLASVRLAEATVVTVEATADDSGLASPASAHASQQKEMGKMFFFRRRTPDPVEIAAPPLPRRNELAQVVRAREQSTADAVGPTIAATPIAEAAAASNSPAPHSNEQVAAGTVPDPLAPPLVEVKTELRPSPSTAGSVEESRAAVVSELAHDSAETLDMSKNDEENTEADVFGISAERRAEIAKRVAARAAQAPPPAVAPAVGAHSEQTVAQLALQPEVQAGDEQVTVHAVVRETSTVAEAIARAKAAAQVARDIEQDRATEQKDHEESSPAASKENLSVVAEVGDANGGRWACDVTGASAPPDVTRRRRLLRFYASQAGGDLKARELLERVANEDVELAAEATELLRTLAIAS